jgi:hypothetical protein
MSQRWESNPQPQLYESCALPIELRWLVGRYRTPYGLHGRNHPPRRPGQASKAI